MAAEVHDSLAQSLAFVKMRMPLLEDALRGCEQERAMRYCDDVRGAVSQAHASLRGLLTHFRSPMDPQGLVHALEAAAHRFRDCASAELDFVNELPGLKLGPDEEAQVFHIVQEALSNVARHASARHARLQVAGTPLGGVDIVVEDDGAGLPRGHRRRGVALRAGDHARTRSPPRRHAGDRRTRRWRNASALGDPGRAFRRWRCRGSPLMVAPRIVLVDDHALCRNGLTDLLTHRGGMEVLAALSDPDQVIAVLREQQPDLVVLDLRMPAIDGLTLLRRIRAEGIDTPALILTMSDSEATSRLHCVPACAATCSRTWSPKT